MGDKWTGPICQVNTWTDDDRIIEEFLWRDTPLTLRAQFLDNGGHSNATPTGAVESVEIVGNDVMGSGMFSTSDDGFRHSEAVEDGSLCGVSVDPCKVLCEDIIIAGDGTQVPIEEWWAYPPGKEPWPEPFRFATIYHQYVMGALTGVAIPAFAGAKIMIAEDLDAEVEDLEAPMELPDLPAAAQAAIGGQLSPDAMVLRSPRGLPDKSALAVAPRIGKARSRLLASASYRPPVAAFRKRKHDEFTPFTIDPETRYFHGHAYPWFGRHRGFRQSGTTVAPPTSRDFTQFLNGGSVTCDNGETFNIGVMTYKGGHGDTAAEYNRIREDPANQLGPCMIYADDYGVQVCGIAWPDIDPVDLSRACASYPSGDWQWHGGEQKLHGLALVNNPGFHSLEQEGVIPVRMVASMARVKMPAQATASQEAVARRRQMSAKGLLDLRRLDKLRKG